MSLMSDCLVFSRDRYIKSISFSGLKSYITLVFHRNNL